MVIKEIQVAGHNLIIHEHDVVYDSATGRTFTGSWLWDSSIILSHWLATSPLDFHGKSVIELGAGTGLPGLTAAVLGASRVVLTDIAPLLPGLRKTVESNGLGDRVEVSELVWGSEKSTGEVTESGVFDVVLMSDVFYEAEQMAALGDTLRRVGGERGEIVAASEVRAWTGECLNELASQGFGVVELPSGIVDGDENVFALYSLIPPVGIS